MMRFDVPLIDQAMHPYFRDIQDHVIRLVESIDDLRDLLAAALEAHLLLSSVEQNKIIKIFSVAAVVLMPPDANCLDLRHEFQKHAGAGMAIRLSGGTRPDVDGSRVALFVLQMEEVAIKPPANTQRTFALHSKGER
jgi:hypothetical protein